jgi:hypothetical protein
MFKSIRLSEPKWAGSAFLIALLGCSGTPHSDLCNGNSVSGTAGTDPCASTGGASTGGTVATGGVSTTGGTTGLGGSSGLPMPVLDFTCTTDTDCCIVADECIDRAWLVTKWQQGELGAYVASQPHTMCLACIPPAVQVSCQNGLCAGQKVGYAMGALAAFGKGHCGTLPLPAVGGAGAFAVLGATADASQGGVMATGGASAIAPAKTTFGCSD